MQKTKAGETTHNKAEVKYKAIKYIRLSVADEHSGESDSIANQRNIIDAYLSKHPEIEVVGEKIDDGCSGIVFDRPGFNEMMEAFIEGRANCCVTKDLSRFGREYIETGRYLRDVFPTLGVRFIAINDNVDTLTDKGDDLVVSLKTIINDSYCQDISIKTRSSLAAKRANGEYVGAFTIYGYKKSEHNHSQLVIDEYAAAIVREIFAMKLEGVSTASIADTLNERGVLSPIEYKREHGLQCARKGYCDRENAKWSVSTILRLLRDETYTGTLIQGIFSTPNYKLKVVVIKPESEWKRIENTHEAIISKRDFDLMKDILLLDSRTPPKSNKVHIFSGMLSCGCCGNRMTRKEVFCKDVKRSYLWCPTTKKRGCHKPALIDEKKFMEFILENVKTHVANVISLERTIAGMGSDKLTLGIKKHLTSRINENKKRLEKIRGYEASLDDNLLNGNLTKMEYNSIKANYAKDADIVIADNERLRLKINGAISNINEQLAWMEHFKEFSDINALDRKTVISLIRHIKITGKTEIEIAFRYQSEYEAALALIGVVN